MRWLRAITLLVFTAVSAQAATAQNPMAAQIQQQAAGVALLESGDLHVILCGTSGPLYAADRGGPCTAVIADGRFFLIDAGSRTVDSLSRLGLPVDRLTALLITHFHSDHMAEIGEINFMHWTRGSGKEPLEVWGPEGIDAVVAGFNSAYDLDRGYRFAHHGEAIMPPSGSRAVAKAFSFEGDAQSKVIYDQDGFVVTAFLVDHPPIVPSVGYRFDYGGRSVVISGDTKRSANLVKNAKGADLLIHEVISDQIVRMIKPSLESAGNSRGATILEDALGNHTFPPDVFALAAEAGVRALTLSHLVPPLPAAQANQVFTRGKETFSGEVRVGEDGMHFVLEKDGKGMTVDNLLERSP